MFSNIRKLALIIADAFIIITSGITVGWLIPIVSDFLGPNFIMRYRELFVAIGVNTVICFLTLWLFGAYATLWRYSRAKDYLCCVFGMISGCLLSALGFNLIQTESLNIPITYFILTDTFALIGTCLFRLIFRNTFLEIRKHTISTLEKNVMIIGAGNASMLLLKEIENSKSDENNPARAYKPVCLVDDDRKKLHTKILGVEVAGATKDIPELVKKYEVEEIILAIPSCSENDRKRIMDICSQTKCKIKNIPYLGKAILDSDESILSKVKDIKIEDLLGRNPIEFDNEDIKQLVKNKVIMVTGGGGSIGSELVRQVCNYSPKQVVIVDIYENSAYEIQQEILMDHGADFNLVTLIASVRDFKKMSIIFEKYRPDIVFHAAAHKHVPLMETSPEEAVKNNVFGTFNVMNLSEYYGVKKFIMISTDKAVNPTNVMGATKRCCEMIAQYMSQTGSNTEFVTTRFGNVLGSNGSVIPLFRNQIENGKPVTVTHPDIIRYFMTIPEAVSLVLQAGSMAKGGEIFVLDMGSPVKILTLAENLIRMYGKEPYKDVEIKFTGLRPGEKLYEELLMSEEGLKSTDNKKIFIGSHINIDQKEFIDKLYVLQQFARDNDTENTLKQLANIVPTFHHQTNEKK